MKTRDKIKEQAIKDIEENGDIFLDYDFIIADELGYIVQAECSRYNDAPDREIWI